MTDLRPVSEASEDVERRPPRLRAWLAPPIPGSPLWGWLLPLFVTAFAGFLRFDRLGQPKAVVFDETYYAKDSLALLQFGWEHSTVKDADKLLIANESTRNIWADGPSFVAHPPAGKWMIAIGEWLFGATPFGWRFMPALVGTLSVLILCRVARRMTGSTLLGCAAGLLLALDGLAFVTSRTALLDVFVMFWILCAFACLVADRDRARLLLARKMETHDGSGFGPFVMHWWRIPAGICLGMACATKWTGVFYIAAFGLLALAWDMGARRAAGIRYGRTGALLFEAVPAFLSMVVLAAITYVAAWSGWIFRPGGWGRGEVAGNPLLRPFEALPDLWRYHKEMWDFHVGLDAKHTYQSWPWDWPVLRRPVAFFYTEPAGACGSGNRCSREILGIGTPAFWWGALIALVVVLCIWLLHRDWRAGAIVLGYAAGLVPWFPSAFQDRTMFLFYATPLLPFMALAIVLVLGLLIGPGIPQPVPARTAVRAAAPAPAPARTAVPDRAGYDAGYDDVGSYRDVDDHPDADRDEIGVSLTKAEASASPAHLAPPPVIPVGIRRTIGASVAGAYLLVVLFNFAYFYPILAAKVITYDQWHARIWFDTWI